MRYRVTIPPPKAKRMLGSAKLIVTLYDCWSSRVLSYDQENKEIFTGPETAEFEVPNEYEYIYRSSVIDGSSFDVHLEYSNAVGTRKETIKLVPQEV